MAALISKPGITNASVLAIPKTWDGTWFRSFVNSQLTGADVRNAVGKNGIVVSGTLASPYATISLGGTGAITLTNDVTISPTSGVGLTINAAAGQFSEVVNIPDNGTGISFVDTGPVVDGIIAFDIYNGTTLIGSMGSGTATFSSAGVNDLSVVATNANLNLIANSGRVFITPDLTITAAGSDVALTVNGSNSSPAISVDSGNTGGCALYCAGLLIPALVMDSTGADFGMIQNSATQIWSLAAGTSNIANGTPVLSWGPAAVYCPGVGTTASAANAFLNSASSPVNQLLRSTSSLRYKTNVQSIKSTDINAVLQMRPVTYTSLAPADNPATAYLGFIAEEMALIDPRLVQYTPSQTQNGAPVANAPLVPDSVMYDRVVTLLVGAVQTLAQRVAQLEATAASMAVVPPTATLSLAGTYNLTGTNVVATPSVVTVLPSTIPTPIPTKGENIP